MMLKPKKTILVFIDWYTPGYKAGGPIRSCANLVAQLSGDYAFKIVTRNTDYTETTPYLSVKSDCWNTLKDGTEVYYFSENELNRKNIRHLISTTAFDAVYLNSMYSVYFTLYPLVFLRKKHEKLVVVAVRGMLAESAIRIKKQKKKFFLRAVKVLRLFNRVVFHASTLEEQKDIQRQLGKHVRIRIAGNLPAKELPERNTDREKKPGLLRLVSIARIAPEKNLLYALKVLSRLRDLNVVFDVYGPVYDELYWKLCKDEIAGLPTNIVVNVKGSIAQENVPQLLLQYHFLFMPSRGENFGHIILQAMTAGCPVILSDQTPWRELSTRELGWDIPLASEERFGEAIRTCEQMNQETYRKLSDTAFAYAKKYVQDLEVVDQNRKLFD
jgi:glycosyltransferase involved in cell wall biosynthesis